jgi:uncharacterized protein YlxW (UPF0749 family)
MKTREVMVLIIGTVATLVFVGFMFDYYLRIEETQVVKKNMWYDSVLLEEQKHLKTKDSILLKGENTLKNQIHNHEYRINKLEKSLDK